MVPPGLNVRGFLDSPLWVDELPMLPTIMPLQNETQAIYGLINATARIPPACAAAYPGAEGWKCLYGQYRIPFMTTPYLMSASQFDKYQLPYNEGGNPPYLPGTPQLAFADGFQGLVRSVVLNMPTASQPGSAVYSSACFKHCTSTLGSFWGVRIGDVSLNDYLAAWYFGAAAQAGGPRGPPALPPGGLCTRKPKIRGVYVVVGFGGFRYPARPQCTPPGRPALGRCAHRRGRASCIVVCGPHAQIGEKCASCVLLCGAVCGSHRRS